MWIYVLENYQNSCKNFISHYFEWGMGAPSSAISALVRDSKENMINKFVRKKLLFFL